jgi:hypothetical protein
MAEPDRPPASTAKRVGSWIWLLIYGGMFALALGLAVQRTDAALGWPITLVGALLIAIGIAMIWLRSRMHDASP